MGSLLLGVIISYQPYFLWFLQVLNHLDDHLKRSQYFRFLWFPHSENVTVIYQDPTNKAGTTRPQEEGRRAITKAASQSLVSSQVWM